MRARDHGAVAAEQARPFPMQVFIRRHVEVRADVRQPRRHVGVRVEGPCHRARLQVQHRAFARRVHHAAAIDVVFVERFAHFRVREEIAVGRIAVAREGFGLVGVGRVGGGGGEVKHRRRCRARGRADEEHRMVFAGGRRQAHGIDAARQALGHTPLDVRCPTGIREVIFVEVDGGVLGRIVPPALGGAVPACAGDGACRMLVGDAPVPAYGVHQVGTCHFAAEVPRGHQVSAILEARCLDAAVEAGRAMSRRKVPIPGRATDAEGTGRGTGVLGRLRHREAPHR